jgi:hypothetical protein
MKSSLSGLIISAAITLPAYTQILVTLENFNAANGATPLQA